MNVSEFLNCQNKFYTKDKIEIQCSFCSRLSNILKMSILDNIEKNQGKYKCQSCTMKGKKWTEERKKAKSEERKSFFLTPEGIEQKKMLSQKASKENAQGKKYKYRIHGIIFSKKMNKNIPYSSSYELKFIDTIDKDPLLISYEAQIPYTTEKGNGRCIDILAKYNDKIVLYEIKPKIRLNEIDIINQIEDHKMYSKKMNYEFQIITEDFFGITQKELTLWGVEKHKKISGIDLIEYYKQQNRNKSKKHRDKNNNYVWAWSEFQQKHIKIRYFQWLNNVKKNNGTFICKMEKLANAERTPIVKENPYSSENKKECSECHKVLSYEFFNKDKSRRDGYHNKCKECYSIQNKTKYEKSKGNQVLPKSLPVQVYCEYCKINHTITEISYKKNIKKNGRYICPKESSINNLIKRGLIEENPYVSEGKKQCKKCEKILLFDEFEHNRNVCISCMKEYRHNYYQSN